MRVIMNKYKIHRMSVLVSLMCECIDCGTDEMIDVLRDNLITIPEAVKIRQVIEEMEG